MINILFPLEKVMEKSNFYTIYKILPKHYILDSHLEKDFLQSIYVNDVPYFEVNMSLTNSADTLLVYSVLIITFSILMPYITYQLILFATPAIYKYKKKKIVRLLYAHIFFFCVANYLMKNYIISILVKNNLIATEEISYYAFEIDFNIEYYFRHLITIFIFNGLFITSLLLFKFRNRQSRL